jgi:tetratricopeptide (TPR) repeat protein
MKRFSVIMVAIVCSVAVLASGVSDALMMKLNKLKEERRIPEYYSTAFMALANDPDNLDLMDATAEALQLMGAFPRAQAVCERILTIEPGRVETEKRLEDIRKNLKEINAKIKQLQEKIEENPDNGQSYVTLATIYVGLKDYSNARDAVNKAVRLAPSNVIAKLMQNTYKQQLDEATKKAIVLSQDALGAYNKGHEAEAETLFKSAFTLSVISPFVYETYATYLVKEKKLGGALRALEEQHTIHPDPGQGLDMGNICYLLKKYNRALAYYSEEFKYSRYSPKAHYNMGLCLMKLGDKQGAKEQFDIAFKQMPKLKEMKSNTVFVRGVKFEI